MSSIIDNILPVFVLIAVGWGLLRLGLTQPAFYTTSDRLCYFIFFPALLFWKIGGAGPQTAAALRLWGVVLPALALVWLASLILIRAARIGEYQAGTFSQVSFRFNTYIGMAVVLSAHGEAGAAAFGVIIGAAIPFINLLCVSTLIWYSGKDYGPAQKAAVVAREVVLNPLILSCLAGLAYAQWGPPLPKFIDNTFRLMASVTLPLALFSIGGGISLDKLRGPLRLALGSCGLKLVLLPAVGWVMLRLWGVTGVEADVAMIYFSLPTATSAYILSRQLNSDADLAAASIVLTTLLGFFSLSAAVLL